MSFLRASSVLLALLCLMPLPAGAISFANFMCDVQLTGSPVESSFGPSSCIAADALFGQPSSLPGSNGQEAAATGSAGSSQTPPLILTSTSAENGGFGASATASLTYSVGLTLLRPLTLFHRIPVTVSGSGSVVTSALNLLGSNDSGFATGTAYLNLRAGAVGQTGFITACQTVIVDDPACGGFPADDQFHISVTAGLAFGEEIQIEARATSKSQGAYNPTTMSGTDWTSTAKVDPYAWIDPTYMILVDGEMVPANTVYALIASPGIDFVNVPDPAMVPLPSAAFLVIPAFMALTPYVARRRRRVAKVIS